MKIIGFCGSARSGKDTLKTMIMDRIPSCHVYTISFADPLKDAAAQLLGMSRDELEKWKENGEKIDGWGFTARHFLQNLGTEGIRSVDSNFFIKHADKRVNRLFVPKLLAENATVLVPDVRFQNEAEWIRNTPGGFLVHVKRPNNPAVTRAHQSEDIVPLLPYITHTVTNHEVSGWEDELANWARTLIVQIYGRHA